jgi:flagellar basal-body rod protein FlgB
MSSKIFDSVDRLESALTFHRERHAILAGNVANVDTPGYQPLDLEQRGPLAPAGTLATTDARHLQPEGVGGARTVFADPGNAGADGNAVSLEREMAKIDANRVRYAGAAELASRRLALLRYAAGDGQG